MIAPVEQWTLIVELKTALITYTQQEPKTGQDCTTGALLLCHAFACRPLANQFQIGVVIQWDGALPLQQFLIGTPQQRFPLRLAAQTHEIFGMQPLGPISSPCVRVTVTLHGLAEQ